MSGDRVTIADAEHEDAASADEQPAVPDPEMDAGKAPAGSLLGAIVAAVDDQVAGATKVYPVGKIARMSCRYRVLEDAEREKIEKRAQAAAKLRKKTGQDGGEAEQQLDAAAQLLATACVELLWLTDDGQEVPIHEALAAPDQMGSGAPTGPLRYDRSTINLLFPQRAVELQRRLGHEPSSADVARELHRWGKDNHSPLATYGKLLSLWMSGVSNDALEDIAEGN